MPSITYAFLGPDEQAAKFAKKGTATDVTLYNAKHQDAHLNLVTPSRYPEKLSSLLVALDLADEIVLSPTQVDRTLGETIVGAELFQKTRGFLRPGPNAPRQTLEPLLAKTPLKNLEVSEESEGVLRERLYAHAANVTGGPLVLPVDHAFPVKGVGTVVLGLVRSGEISLHQVLQCFPSEKTVDIRSIQVHDVDQKTASTRSRVGLALKGIEAEELPRGTILAPPKSLKVQAAQTPFTLSLQLSPFAKSLPRPGAVLHLFHALQDLVFRVESVQGNAPGPLAVTGRCESALTQVPGQPLVLVDLDNKVQRFVGAAQVSG